MILGQKKAWEFRRAHIRVKRAHRDEGPVLGHPLFEGLEFATSSNGTGHGSWTPARGI